MPEAAAVLIDGAWVRASTAVNREIRNPATLDLLGLVADCGPDDVGRAVEAAARAQPGWWRVPGVEKAGYLRCHRRKAARERARALDGHGAGDRKTADRGGGLHRVGGGLFRLLCRGRAPKLRHVHSARRPAPDQLHDQGAVRRGRGDRAVQLSAPADGLEGGAGPRRRQRARLQATASEPALEPAHGALLRRAAARRGEHDHRRPRDRRGAGPTSARGPHRLYRLRGGGPPDCGAGGPASSRRSISSSAVWIPLSYSRTRTSTSRFPAWRGRVCSTPGRSAPRPSGCTWSSRSRGNSPRSSRPTSAPSASAIQWMRTPTSAPSSRPRPSSWSSVRSRDAVVEGAKLLLGGCRVQPGGLRGHFLAPTILADVPHGSLPTTEEIFGPVLSLTVARTPTRRSRMANDSRYGLGASIYTRDLATAMRAMQEIKAGTFWINDPLTDNDAGPSAECAGAASGASWARRDSTRSGSRSTSPGLRDGAKGVLVSVSGAETMKKVRGGEVRGKR